MITINEQDYRRRVLGCWMGKNIGGTLGAPFEWKRQINEVSFYTQELGGEPLPNDDLDIQLLWVMALEERGIELDAHVLSEYWCLYVTPHWVEYGTAKINMRAGLLPPLCGTLNNLYKHSCGAFIRSEVWACIAPGLPRLAVRYAYEDAILDHGDGEGVYGEMFCAALESAAFVEQDLSKLIEIGLSYIPEDCGVAGAVQAAVAAHQAGKSWREARDEVLRHYRGGMFDWEVSPADHAKGLGGGQLGWDAPANIGMLIIGLLYGEGDFGRTICTAVNCGEDTDCTAATAGAIYGLLHGIEAVPPRWIEPIGRTIKTVTLDLGDLDPYGKRLPRTVDALTERTACLAQQVLLRYQPSVELAKDKPTDLSGVHRETLLAGPAKAELYANLGATVFRFPFFEVAVDYGEEPTIRDNTPKTIRLRVRNTHTIQANLNVRWYAPEGWQVLPVRQGTFFSAPASMGGKSYELTFTLQAERVSETLTRLVVELTSEGRPTVMLAPITLWNGNLAPELSP